MDLRQKFLEAEISLAVLEDGEYCDSVEEWLDMASERVIEEEAIRLGLVVDARGDIYEMDEAARRQRARYAGIRGA